MYKYTLCVLCAANHISIYLQHSLIVIISLKVYFSYATLHLIYKHINAHIVDYEKKRKFCMNGGKFAVEKYVFH